MSNEEVSNEGQNSNTNIEMNSIGINTDTLPEEELRKLVENNKELQDEQDVSNILHEVKDNTINVNNNSNNNELSHINAQIKKDLIDELNEKDKIFNLLVKSNAELKSKIEISTEKYNEILKKINEKQNEKNESKLTLQIKEMEKEINANNAETEHYKRQIDTLKNKIEFKTNLERAFNLQSILKAESMKNAELKNQLKSLERVNGVQIKYINNYDKENRISEKLDILKSEIKQTKDSIKDYQEKFAKQDRFIRLVHEKILSLEMIIKKMKEPKVEKTKLFTREELKKTLDEISSLKQQIGANRNTLNAITKTNDDKMHALLSQNKKIEIDYKENEKLNKMLIFKKNELKRNIKNLNSGEKKNVKLIKRNNPIPVPQVVPQIQVNQVEVPIQNRENIEAIENKEEPQQENQEERNPIINVGEEKEEINQVEPTRKLFSKNPNKINQNEDNNIESMNNINDNNQEQNVSGDPEGDDNEPDMNDSNLNS